MIRTWVVAISMLTAPAAQTDAKPVEISSLKELAVYAAMSGNHVRLKPGSYLIDRIYSDDPKIVFRFSGSNNRIDLTGVRIETDTKVHADMPRGMPHEHSGFLLEGDHIQIIGGAFVDIGEHAAPRGINEFTVLGNDNVFRGCKITIRGSSPYGYGDLYGKGRGAFTKLQKHSAMAILGDRTLVEDCDFEVYAFGHGIHIHGAQDTVIRGVTMKGALRLTDEIYQEQTGLAKEHDYRVMYPPWRKGEAIPKGHMLSLTEDGIRAYLNGSDREGNKRRTGHITVEKCVVKRMRGGITITMASGGTVTDCVVLESGGHAYSVPPSGVVRRCKGDAAFSPLLTMPYSNRHDADIELELLGAAVQERGDHALAEIAGSGHRIKITSSRTSEPEKLRPIIVGTTGDRYTKENTDIGELRRYNAARRVTLINETLHPVHFTEFARDNVAVTGRDVQDEGDGNEAKQPRSPRATGGRTGR